MRERTTPAVVSERLDDGNDDDVDRREFARSAALAAVGLADPLKALTRATAHSREVIGAEHVEFVHAAIARIDAQDTARGGRSLRPGVVALRDQVEDWLTGSYSLDRGVNSELQSASGSLSSWAGWLALDDNDRNASRRHISDALFQARIADDPRLEVEAMDTMCLLLRNERPRESLQCAEAAQRVAQGWATPKLSTLLCLRSALAHAELGQRELFNREVAKAMRHLDQGQHPDDLPFVHFVTPMELTGLRGLSLLALGSPDRAAEEFRSIVDDPDPAYRRNLGYYTVRLAQAQAQNREITAAAQTGMSAMDLAAELESARTARHLAELRAAIEPHRAATPAARDFAEHYDQESATT